MKKSILNNKADLIRKENILKKVYKILKPYVRLDMECGVDHGGWINV